VIRLGIGVKRPRERQFSAEDPDVLGGVDADRDPVARNAIDHQDDLSAHDDLLSYLAGENQH
jgi:hypothetical protein